MTRTGRFHKIGGLEVLQIEALNVGSPCLGEMLVHIEAIGLNRA